MSASESALVAHVVSQVTSNVEFLVAQNYISQADANAIIAKLPSSSATPAAPVPYVARTPSVPKAASGPKLVQARALWTYEDADDLSFAEGDIIDIVEETNADWWMGRLNGKEGLFPSSYVEKISSPNAAAAPAPAAAPAARRLPPFFSGSKSSSNSSTEVSTTSEKPKPAYRPFGAAHHGRDVPPPVGGGTNSVGLQQDPGQEQKKNKYGKYGNTMAHSAAGGVGFGAGAAIGGGLVRAIF